LRAELGIPDGDLVVGTVGALRPEKNQLRLVRAFAQVASKVPAARLMIVGEGSLLASLSREAHAHSVQERVTFCGRVENPSSYYQAMDVFALSSDTEQMPLVVLEAMSAGLPVVSTDVGDVRRMLPPSGKDWVVPPDDATSYSLALQALLADHELRARLGADNRRHCVNHYSLERMLNAYVTLYRELALSHGN
jgi:glycosyltransferase involved in cell wall biosynthesis